MALEISETTFEKDVIEASHTKPVLVDFWAPWCGPCKMLGPALDQVEQEMNGLFKLVKINTDENQNIAGVFQISGIPTVILFFRGQPVDQFSGALPPAEIKKFLEKHVSDPEMDKLFNEVDADPAGVSVKVIAEKRKGEKTDQLMWKAVVGLLQKGEGMDKISPVLNYFPEYGSVFSDNVKYLKTFLGKEKSAEERETFSKIFEAGNEKEVLDFFLKRVETAGENRDSCKDDLLTCFFILGNENPLVNEYRRKLSMLLF